MKRTSPAPRIPVLIALAAFLVCGFAAGCASSSPDLSAARKDLVWPPPPDTARIRFLLTLSDRKSVEGEGSKFLEALVGRETSDELFKPYGIAADGKGRIFVAETGNRPRIFIFDTRKQALTFTGTSPVAPVQLPLGLALDSAGYLYIADGKQRNVLVYSADNSLIRVIGRPGQLQNPTGVALNEERGRVYVVDTHAHAVIVFSMTGDSLFAFGKRGTGEGEFNFPTGIAIGKDGRVYVVDTINSRVEVFDAEGTYLSQFGSIGNRPGQFTRPKGIALDSRGNIYVVDGAFNNYQIFNGAGRLLMHVGSAGTAEGSFWLPAGICIDRADRIYVTDQMNKRVQAFQLIQ